MSTPSSNPPAPPVVPADAQLPPADAPYLAYRQTKYFGSLDGLRCLSIVAVIWHHAAHTSGGPPMLGRGFLGVDMFFVLSGFLIVTLLLRERDAHGQIALGPFYGRRALRIFPPYYALLLAVGILALVSARGQTRAAFLAALPFYLTYTSNWIVHQAPNMGILWSLAAEEQFYLFWPPVERFLSRGRVLLVMGVVIAINQAINFGLLDGWLQSRVGVGRNDLSILQATFTPICLGVLIAHALHDPAGHRRAHRLLGGQRAPLALLALLLVLLNVPNPEIAGVHRLAIQLCMVLLIASCVVREGHILSVPLSWKPVRYVGVISYGMYLYHMWVAHAAGIALKRFGLPKTRYEFAVVLLGTVLVAHLSFRYFETPILRLKRFFVRTETAGLRGDHAVPAPRA